MPKLAKGQTRHLTRNEVALAKSVFGNAPIDYGKVKIARESLHWWQPDNTTITPSNKMFFPENAPHYRDDFGAPNVPLWLKAHFIHEMTHVYQVQVLKLSLANLAVSLHFDRWAFGTDIYAYLPLTPGKTFKDYNVEQQGAIVSDMFILQSGGIVQGAPPLSTYKQLVGF